VARYDPSQASSRAWPGICARLVFTAVPIGLMAQFSSGARGSRPEAGMTELGVCGGGLVGVLLPDCGFCAGADLC